VERSDNRSRIRRAKCLVAFWEDSEFVIQNYLTNKQSVIAPPVAQLLHEISDYLPKSSVLERFSPIPQAEELVRRLLAQDALVAEGSPLDRKEQLLDETWKWKHDARFFHYSTQHVSYEADPDVQRMDLVRLARQTPPRRRLRITAAPTWNFSVRLTSAPAISGMYFMLAGQYDPSCVKRYPLKISPFYYCGPGATRTCSRTLRSVSTCLRRAPRAGHVTPRRYTQ